VSQGMVKKHRRIKLYALAVSIFAHIIALSVFAAVKISQTSPVRLQTTATVSISQSEKLLDSQKVTPKPKVTPIDKKSDSAIRNSSIVKTDLQGTKENSGSAYAISKEYLQTPLQDLRQPAKSETSQKISSSSNEKIEFFNSPAQGRRICFVVDCSGSMQGLWKSVQDELSDSISKLEQDYYFCVIVFGGGCILETGGGKMVRATDKAKKEANDFIKSVRPVGSTNAADALERAIMIKDKTGIGASLIYFLTDGFELSQQDGSRFAHKLATMHKSLAPKTQINTIGFWCTRQDSKMLESIAKESGGRFTLIGKEGMSND